MFNRTITSTQMFSEQCPYSKVKVNGRPYWKHSPGLWVYDDQARPGEYDSAPEVSDPENAVGYL